jgi:hypothetical protein
MNRMHRKRPGLELLESRNLLSATQDAVAGSPTTTAADQEVKTLAAAVDQPVTTQAADQPATTLMAMSGSPTTTASADQPVTTLAAGEAVPTSAVVPLSMTAAPDHVVATSADVPQMTTTAADLAATTSAPVTTSAGQPVPVSASLPLESAGPDGHPVPISAVINRLSRRNRGHDLALRGQVTGTWTTQPSNPDAGAVQTLSGSGRVQPLGRANARGSLHMTGFIASGNSTGSLKLTGNGGSVTLSLVGTPQRGSSAPPTSWTYTVASGTGRHARAGGQGTATLVETSGTLGPRFTLTLQPGAMIM